MQIRTMSRARDVANAALDPPAGKLGGIATAVGVLASRGSGVSKALTALIVAFLGRRHLTDSVGPGLPNA